MMPARVNGSQGTLRPIPRVTTEEGMLIRARAFAVHIFTAAGAALALAALLYAARREWAAMFLCLGIALIIDAVDGPGFLVNRCNRPWGLESLKLLAERVATVEQIDTAITEVITEEYLEETFDMPLVLSHEAGRWAARRRARRRPSA